MQHPTAFYWESHVHEDHVQIMGLCVPEPVASVSAGLTFPFTMQRLDQKNSKVPCSSVLWMTVGMSLIVQGREADIGKGDELKQETGGGVGEGHGGLRKETEGGGGAQEWEGGQEWTRRTVLVAANPGCFLV